MICTFFFFLLSFTHGLFRSPPSSFILHLLGINPFSTLESDDRTKIIDRLHCIMDLGYEEFTVRYNPLGYTI